MTIRITSHHRGVWMSGDLALTLAGSYTGPTPCVGDYVRHRETQIIAVEPRRTFFARRAAGRETIQQAIAANVDVAFIVMGLDGDFNLRRLERYLALTWESGARPVVLLSKADLCADLDGKIIAAQTVAGSIGVHPIASPSGGGVDTVREYLAPGTTAVLLGSSGAGKSTLMNALLGFDLMPTQAVRESDSRGRHTTTHRELIPLPSGAFLIDTPGMRELQLWADEESVAAVFSDIESVAENCRFADCQHENEPGCAVQAAIENGTLDPARLASERKLLREARHLAEKTNVNLMLERKSKWKAIHRAMRKLPDKRA